MHAKTKNAGDVWGNDIFNRTDQYENCTIRIQKKKWHLHLYIFWNWSDFIFIWQLWFEQETEQDFVQITILHLVFSFRVTTTFGSYLIALLYSRSPLTVVVQDLINDFTEIIWVFSAYQKWHAILIHSEFKLLDLTFFQMNFEVSNVWEEITSGSSEPVQEQVGQTVALLVDQRYQTSLCEHTHQNFKKNSEVHFYKNKERTTICINIVHTHTKTKHIQKTAISQQIKNNT